MVAAKAKGPRPVLQIIHGFSNCKLVHARTGWNCCFSFLSMFGMYKIINYSQIKYITLDFRCTIRKHQSLVSVNIDDFRNITHIVIFFLFLTVSVV